MVQFRVQDESCLGDQPIEKSLKIFGSSLGAEQYRPSQYMARQSASLGGQMLSLDRKRGKGSTGSHFITCLLTILYGEQQSAKELRRLKSFLLNCRKLLEINERCFCACPGCRLVIIP